MNGLAPPPVHVATVIALGPIHPVSAATNDAVAFSTVEFGFFAALLHASTRHFIPPDSVPKQLRNIDESTPKDPSRTRTLHMCSMNVGHLRGKDN